MLNMIITTSSLLLISNKKYSPALLMITLSAMTLLSFPTSMHPYSNFSSILMTDSLSHPLISLTLWVSMLMIMASMKMLPKANNNSTFLMILTTLCLTLIITFSSSSLMMFYIFFEASLIPTTLMVLIWGYQPERLQASFYLMIYTICASLPLLASIIMIKMTNNHLSLLLEMKSTPTLMSMSIWWMITISAFLVKMPIYGVHLWLPKAHVEAPIAGSMILAGILLKLGGYGLLRLAFMFQSTNSNITTVLIPVTLMGAMMTSIICLRQSDLKSLIAYSSVSHMGLMTAGIMSNTSWGWQGALVMMIAHGLSSSGLFAIANMAYESTHTRSILLTKGILNVIPSMSMAWFLLVAANMAVPPSINLMSEIMLISSIMSMSLTSAIPIIIITMFSCAYSLILYTSPNHGSPPSSSNPPSHPFIRNNHINLLHILPVFILILSPNNLSMWLY